MEAPGKEGKLCAIGISHNKACVGTYETGQQQSGTETSLVRGMGAKGPSNLRQSSSSEGTVIIVLFYFPSDCMNRRTKSL